MPHDSSGCWVSFLGGIGLAAKINFYPAKTYFPSGGDHLDSHTFVSVLMMAVGSVQTLRLLGSSATLLRQWRPWSAKLSEVKSQERNDSNCPMEGHSSTRQGSSPSQLGLP